MKPYCEVIVKEVLPAFRAMLAKEMMDKYNLTQDKVAKKLGITQAAVSQYRRQLRGFKMNKLESDKDVNEIVDKIASGMASDKGMDPLTSMRHVCTLCKKLRNKDYFSDPQAEVGEC